MLDRIAGSNTISQSIPSSHRSSKKKEVEKDHIDISDSFAMIQTGDRTAIDVTKASRLLLNRNTDGPEKLDLAWNTKCRADVKRRVSTGPDGTVYGITCEGGIFALDGATGGEKWTKELGKKQFSDPVVGENGLLYVGTKSNEVFAIDTKTGEKAWEYATTPGKESQVQTPDALAVDKEGTVYIASWWGKIVALDGNTGEKKWAFSTEKGVPGSVAVDNNGTVYAESYDGTVYALNSRTGGKKWELKMQFGIMESASPSVGPDNTVYTMCCMPPKWGITNGRTRLTAIGQNTAKSFLGKEKTKPQKLWEIDFDGASKSSPALGTFNGCQILFMPTGDGQLRAIDAKTGRNLWSLTTEKDNVFLTSFGSDGRTPVIDEKKGLIYMSSKDGILLAINAVSGKVVWNHEFYLPFKPDGSHGNDGNPLSIPFLDTEGSLCVADLEGTVSAFKHPRISNLEKELSEETETEKTAPQVIQSEKSVYIDGLRLDKKA